MTSTLHAKSASAADELEIASFHVGEALMGVPIEQVEEINHHLELTPVPHAPAAVRGVMNLRGQVVTVIDLRTVLGMEPAAATRHTCNVVVRSQGEQIGLLADRVGDVVRARMKEIEPPPPNMAGGEGRCFRGVHKLAEGLLVLLDVEKTLAFEMAGK